MKSAPLKLMALIFLAILVLPLASSEDARSMEKYLDCLTDKKADIVFVFDTSNSMGGEINELSAVVRDFATDLGASRIDYRLGLVEFRDFPITCGEREKISCGSPGDLAYKVKDNGTLTAEVSTFGSWLRELKAGGGGTGGPEAVLAALRHAGSDLLWRSDAEKVIIVLTDAGPHPDGDCCNAEGDTLEGTIFGLTSQGARVHVIGSEDAALRRIAGDTGGQFFKIRSGLSLKPLLKEITGAMSCSFRVEAETTCLNRTLEAKVQLVGKDVIPFVAGQTEAWMYLDQAGSKSRYNLSYDQAAGAYLANVLEVCGPVELTVYGRVGERSAVQTVQVECGTCGDAAEVVQGISNQPPEIIGLKVDPASPLETGATITWTAMVNDPDSDPIFYRFFLDDKPVTDWTTENNWIWTPSAADSYRIEAQVRDGKHAGPSGLDDRRSGRFEITTPTSATKARAVQETNFESMRVLGNLSTEKVSVAFSPDGQILASGNRYNTITLWDTASGKEIRTIEGINGAVLSVAFSPDGRTLASGSESGQVKLWDNLTGNEIMELEPAGWYDWASCVVFSPDGLTLASASDGTLKLWDTSNGSLIRTLGEDNSRYNVVSVAFSPDGSTLASTGNGTVKLWDTSSGSQIQTLEGHSDWVNSVAFSPDGSTLVSESNDGTIELWDTASSSLISTIDDSSASGFGSYFPYVSTRVAFSPDGHTLASSSRKLVKLWDTASSSLIRTLEGHSDRVNSIAFSPDGLMLASASDDRSVNLYDMVNRSPIRTLANNSGSVESIAFSPDGHTLASSSGKLVKLWDTASSSLIRTLEGHTDRVNSIAFSPDGQMLASAGIFYYPENDMTNITLDLWDTNSGSLIRTLEDNYSGSVIKCVAFSPDGSNLASGSSDGATTLWDVASGKEIQQLKNDSYPYSTVSSIAFSPDGLILASGCWNGTVILWNISSGSMIRTLQNTLEEGCNEVLSIAVNPDGRTLASTSCYTINLWDINSGSLIRTMRHEYFVNSVSFSPDGSIIASGSSDSTGTVKLWDVASGNEIRLLNDDELYSAVSSVAFSPDGSTLASGTYDGTILLRRMA